jgi:hypothetical protein
LRVRAEPFHKRAVDLERIDGKALQIAQ